jgi:hypothetical protein
MLGVGSGPRIIVIEYNVRVINTRIISYKTHCIYQTNKLHIPLVPTYVIQIVLSEGLRVICRQ